MRQSLYPNKINQIKTASIFNVNIGPSGAEIGGTILISKFKVLSVERKKLEEEGSLVQIHGNNT